MKNSFDFKSKVSIKSGQTLVLCRCWKSNTFPYCDGSHRKDPISNSQGPAVITCK